VCTISYFAVKSAFNTISLYYHTRLCLDALHHPRAGVVGRSKLTAWIDGDYSQLSIIIYKNRTVQKPHQYPNVGHMARPFDSRGTVMHA
jgi:hypothetical protein